MMPPGFSRHLSRFLLPNVLHLTAGDTVASFIRKSALFSACRTSSIAVSSSSSFGTATLAAAGGTRTIESQKQAEGKNRSKDLDDLEDVIARARRVLNHTAGVSRARGRTTRGKPPGEIPGGECPPDGVRTGRGESADGGSRGGDSSGAAENGSSSRFPRRGYAR